MKKLLFEAFILTIPNGKVSDLTDVLLNPIKIFTDHFIFNLLITKNDNVPFILLFHEILYFLQRVDC